VTQGLFHSGPARTQAQAILTVDLGALVHNWRLLRDLSAPAECASVVKADAYGIGIEPAVTALANAGCRTFFVAHASEGARARTALGKRGDCHVYALNGLLPNGGVLADFAALDIRPVIGSIEELRAWLRAGELDIARMPAALQFNTGMNRLGIDASDAQSVRELVTSANADKHVALVMSHFVSSEATGDPANREQIAAFDRVRRIFEGFRTSLANSSGIFLPQKPHCDLVRPGYALYGGNPTPGHSNPMKHVIRLQAPIIQVRDVVPGSSVGYNAQWVAKRPSRLATIGIGYADGLPRSAMDTPEKPGAQAIVAGHFCSIVGRISMDLIVIDVTDVEHDALAPGVLAELLGEHIGVDDLAARAGTIGYEILTSLGPRYHRAYIRPGDS
jgi:alanine racemase